MNPRVAISSCLLGRNVRYDGGHKRREWLSEAWVRKLDLVPLCPELDAGLGVPRPPVRLVFTAGGIRALDIERPARDVTDPLMDYCTAVFPHLLPVAGFILKARSPSCGYRNAPLFDTAGSRIRLDSGLFAAYVERELPEIPIIDEAGIQDPAQRNQFLNRVLAQDWVD